MRQEPHSALLALRRVAVIGAASAVVAVAAFILIAPAFLRPGADRLALVQTPRDYGVAFELLIVEVPTPAPEFAADTSLRPRLEAVRSLIRERMLRGREPSRSGSVLTHPACVEVAGQLFYDDAHVGDQPRGKKGMKGCDAVGVASADAHRLQSGLHAVTT